MKDAAKTIGNLIDHANVSIIGSIDKAGFPNTKAMLPPRKRVGIKHIYFTTNLSSMRVMFSSKHIGVVDALGEVRCSRWRKQLFQLLSSLLPIEFLVTNGIGVAVERSI